MSVDLLLDLVRPLIPRRLFAALQPTYHYLLAAVGAIIYRFPSRRLTVIAVTGTKGKSSTVELIAHILISAGYKTASVSTVSFRIGDEVRPNLFKMTLRGRFFLQRFLRQAIRRSCQYAVVEMSSEGVKQFRHKFIDLDALVFTNLAPEHIESHGSFENYRAAKLKLAEALARSPKRPRAVIANIDDPEGDKFLSIKVEQRVPFSLSQAKPYSTTDTGVSLTLDGQTITAALPGLFSVYNILAAASLARTQGINQEIIAAALQEFSGVAGRAERVYATDPNKRQRQNFDVIVDYAHTAESLRQIYEAFTGRRRIAVLGSTGGGRDKWKRPLMGQIADEYCDKIFLTNEDPYDEDPEIIVREVAAGITGDKYSIIMDRRQAIRAALAEAKPGDVVLITGKGTDPYIMEAKGKKTPWSDARIAAEELNQQL